MTETDCDEKTFTLFSPFLLTGPAQEHFLGRVANL